MTDLKPCPNPWCDKSDPQMQVTARGWAYVECDNCLTGRPRFWATNAEAIAAWNTRPAPKVKPLEWMPDPFYTSSLAAPGIGCTYLIPMDDPEIEVKKAAVQKDYAARILAALVTE